MWKTPVEEYYFAYNFTKKSCMSVFQIGQDISYFYVVARGVLKTLSHIYDGVFWENSKQHLLLPSFAKRLIKDV